MINVALMAKKALLWSERFESTVLAQKINKMMTEQRGCVFREVTKSKMWWWCLENFYITIYSYWTHHRRYCMFVSTLPTELWGMAHLKIFQLLHGFICYWKMYSFSRSTVVCSMLYGFGGAYCMPMRHGTDINQRDFTKHIIPPQGSEMLHYCFG
jgi:hypothetical protein